MVSPTRTKSIVLLVLAILHPYWLGCTVLGGVIGSSASRSEGPSTVVSLAEMRTVELPAPVILRLRDSTEVSGLLLEFLTLSEEDYADAWEEAGKEAAQPPGFGPQDRVTVVAGQDTVEGVFLHLDQGSIVLSRGGSPASIPLAGSLLITHGGSLVSGDSVLSLVVRRMLPSRTNLKVESSSVILVPVEAIEEASFRSPGTVSPAGPIIGILIGAAVDVAVVLALSSGGSSGGNCSAGSGGTLMSPS